MSLFVFITVVIVIAVNWMLVEIRPYLVSAIVIGCVQDTLSGQACNFLNGRQQICCQG